MFPFELHSAEEKRESRAWAALGCDIWVVPSLSSDCALLRSSGFAERGEPVHSVGQRLSGLWQMVPS